MRQLVDGARQCTGKVLVRYLGQIRYGRDALKMCPGLFNELPQFLRLLFVAAPVLGGIGVPIGGGSSALELIAMR